MQPYLCCLCIYTVLSTYMCCGSITQHWVPTLAAVHRQSIRRFNTDEPCTLQRPRIDAGHSPFLAEILISFSARCWAGLARLCSAW